MKKIIILLLVFTACQTQAELYKSLDENGEVVYSDTPPTPGAEAFKPPALQVQPAIKIPPKQVKPVDPTDIAYSYTTLTFSKPEADENFHSIEANISYALAIIPALGTKYGHYLNIKLDDEIVSSKTASLSGTLKNVNRGSHSLVAEVCDADGAVLSSASVTFHVHKFSSLMKPNTTPVPVPTIPKP